MWGIYMSLIDIAQRNKEGQNKPSRYYSNKQEKKVAKDFNGVQTKNSGATKFGGKGDVLLPGLMSIECKTKTSKSGSISIKREWLDKITKESLFDGKKYYSLAFNFGPDEENYYIIDGYLFNMLIEYISNVEGVIK